jgi:hypothetical protein
MKNTTEIKKFLNKRIKLVLSNGFHYSGKVVGVNEDYLRMIDKFDEDVLIKLSDIIVCAEEKK